MRKFLGLLCCILLLCPRAAAAERKYVAVILEDPVLEGPMLENLSRRNARVTVFLSRGKLETAPNLAQALLDGGHEIGLRNQEDFVPLSRRAIARTLNDQRSLLPQKCPVRFFRPGTSRPSDGTRQVARALGLCLVEGRTRPAWPENSAWILSPLGRIQDGDILLAEEWNLPNLVELLQNQGYTLVTLSRLAALRQAQLHPGQTYTRFPPAAAP